MEVEVIQDDLQLCEIFCCDCITLHDITEVKEHGNWSKIDLLHNKYQLVWYQISFALHGLYLHECL